MTERPAVFTEDWRSCQRAHFQHVVASGDVQNERSLLRVLTKLGFSERELSDLRAAALNDREPDTANPAPVLRATLAEGEEMVEAAAASNSEAAELVVEPEDVDDILDYEFEDAEDIGEDSLEEEETPQLNLFE